MGVESNLLLLPFMPCLEHNTRHMSSASVAYRLMERLNQFPSEDRQLEQLVRCA